MAVYTKVEAEIIERGATLAFETNKPTNPHKHPEAKGIWRRKFDQLTRDESARQWKVKKSNRRR